MNVKEVLYRAADQMQTHGKANERFIVLNDNTGLHGKIGSMCLQGAVQAAMGIPYDQIGSAPAVGLVYDAAIKSLAQEILAMENLPEDVRVYPPLLGAPMERGPAGVVAQWNNHHSTEKQAIALLRAVADKMEA